MVSRLVAIGEGVHLLFDDVGSFAAGALIKLDALKQRNPDLVNRVTFGDGARAFLDDADGARVAADQILKPSEAC